jgi:plasmid stabilization system protein ParE
MTGARWGIRLGAAAEADFVRILEYTSDTFRQRQSDLYRDLIQEALAALAAGPEAPGGIARDDIRPGLRSLHVAPAVEGATSSSIARLEAISPWSCGSCMIPWISRGTLPRMKLSRSAPG